MAALIQVVQHVGVPGWGLGLCCYHVPYQLVGRSSDNCHHHCVVQVRGLQETRG